MPARLGALSFVLALALVVSSNETAHAAWTNSPFTNLAISTATNTQAGSRIVPDGSGGAIITWLDYRSVTHSDIYAQHVRANGTVDPAWPANGLAVCTAPNNQQGPNLVSDGAGGAIITWMDSRDGNADAYAQRVLSTGAVDPAWPANGRALCTAAGEQKPGSIVSDGAGGAIICWHDARDGIANQDIYAQRVLPNGTIAPGWPAGGLAVSTAVDDQWDPRATSDGAGGAIVVWQDFRFGINGGLYFQHVLPSGIVDPTWDPDGNWVVYNTNPQNHAITEDGAGGALVTWTDYRNSPDSDIYAHHALSNGLVDYSIPTHGVALCTAPNGQTSPAIVSDGAGGAIVAWADGRTSTTNIYAHHLPANGSVDPEWPVNGRALCLDPGGQNYPQIFSDGAGGAIVSWWDYRPGSSTDLYAGHVLFAGTLDPAWPVNGRAVCKAASTQYEHAMTSDGAGGSIVTWTDQRSGGFDIYAQRIARFGYLGTPEGEIASVLDVPNDNGGKVKLSWNASYLDVVSDVNLSAYDVLRSVPPSLALSRIARGAHVVQGPTESFPGIGERLFVTEENSQVYYWELLTSVNALHYVSGYSYLAPTAQDSTPAGAPKTQFMVVARNGSGSMFWPSRPDSGYSVDNLAPAAPALFTAAYSLGATHLHWATNQEADLAGYRVYRGSSAAFTPEPGNLVSAQPDTGYADSGPAGGWYKLSAVDSHGNESVFAILGPNGTLDTPGTSITRLDFALPAPNPGGREGTTLRYSLPRESQVSLAIYDASGRQVRQLVSAVEPAGERRMVWDLRDDGGNAVAPGVYFVRLRAGREVQTRSVAVRP